MSESFVALGEDSVRYANHVPLTPLSFLRRAADVHPKSVAVRHREIEVTYSELASRSRQLAAALAGAGLERGDIVAVLSANTPAHVEAHFGVPMMGGVLNSINIRLDAGTIAYILTHSEARVLLVDEEFAPLARAALAQTPRKILTIGIADAAVPRDPIGFMEYEAWLRSVPTNFAPILPNNEEDPIALCYTSGTTGKPKGVIYDHRGAYLSALGTIVAWSLSEPIVYLWTLPMFHCAGWCFPWIVVALAGQQVCLRRPSPSAIVAALSTYGVTHLCGAPVILSAVAGAVSEGMTRPPRGIKFMTAGASPPASTIADVEELGFEVTHTYGMTEVFGPCVICEWPKAWNALTVAERSRLKARQGVRYALQEDTDVLDPGTMRAVPADGRTLGEIMMRGNMLMRGYLHDLVATNEAFAGGWFHSGDLAVKHPDGYMEIRDRSKDLIISGGENISSLEVEQVLHRHPAIEHAAVVACPDQRWGETPCAFVTVRANVSWDEKSVVSFCREHLAGYKVPRAFVVGELPRTATGKVRKLELRERARLLAEQLSKGGVAQS